ncbi:hypothetical protein PFICI_03349 [Pestalotiopsis fici W106-1]|uniref:Protein kinase domain-containing protein n=1 Tax=Pestalotiopsis fici (strain W106-1 / CGMCC3.15140) TaxID=1229662 RepID=W3XH54_PESFW|nr:uncharacterized protein PFICI_03349 [Pestalotiopsis fici W106-1]ETS85324.1 hypothetical protein PFICI_03349 [Pestalotiopsis fici W106-1]
MWSFGCIILEFLIWLIYGPDQLNRFNSDLGSTEHTRFYLIKPAPGGGRMATVHGIVESWMDQMAKDTICRPRTTALGNLLDLVRTRLLVVKLSERLGTLTGLPEAGSPLGRADSHRPMPSGSELPSEVAVSPSHPGIPTIVEPTQKLDNDYFKSALHPVVSSNLERASADTVMNFMLINSGDDETDAYWCLRQPDQPAGPDVCGVLQRIRSVPAQSILIERVNFYFVIHPKPGIASQYQ